MSTKYKKIWHYQVFDTDGDFVAWQAAGDYEYNILTIVPMLEPCECGEGTTQKVLVTWWETV